MCKDMERMFAFHPQKENKNSSQVFFGIVFKTENFQKRSKYSWSFHKNSKESFSSHKVSNFAQINV